MHHRYGAAPLPEPRVSPDDRSCAPVGVVTSGSDHPAATRRSAPTRRFLRRYSGVLKAQPGALAVARIAPPREPLIPAPPRRGPTPRSSYDPWEHGLALPLPIDEQLQTLSAAVHLMLERLAEHGPADPALEEVRRAVGVLHVRHAVREAREHEQRERWLHASRAWMRAALAAVSDPWLFAHSARTLLLTNASSQDACEVALRAIALDPVNPIAQTVLDRLRD
jgi:hypothetical protein